MKRKISILLAALFLLTGLMVPAGATGTDGSYIIDEAGLLSEEECAALEEKAQTTSQMYGCGVYVITVEDFTEYSEGSIYECAKDIYRGLELGEDEGKDGVLLLLSMADRDYSLIAYGDLGNAAFTDYGKEVLEEKFLDDFKKDDWYGGLEDYLDESAQMLEMALYDQPLDVNHDPEADSENWIGSIAIGVLAGCVIALIVCLVFKWKMKTARIQNTASEYVPEEGVSFRVMDDRFTHITEMRRTIKSDSDSGGTTVDSDGFSGSSGKF